jgi:NTP pyrophosphatase (non-canonical NTP hydrolase)
MQDKLDAISKNVFQFRDARDWKQFHDPKDLAEAISIEAGELLEKFLWMKPEQSYKPGSKKTAEIKDEIADIIIFTLYLCDELKIDLSQAIENKLISNGEKYPVEKSKGTSLKYKEL